jgi:hypothetical protein
MERPERKNKEKKVKNNVQKIFRRNEPVAVRQQTTRK